MLLLTVMLSSSKGQAVCPGAVKGAVLVTGGSLVTEEFHTAVRPRECVSTLRT